MKRSVLVSVVTLFAAAAMNPRVSAQTIRGRVVDRSTGAPVSSAAVTASWVGGDSIGTTLTDRAGTFAVRTIRSGQVVLRIASLGYRTTVTEPVRLGAGEVLSLDIAISPAPVGLEPIVATATRLPESRGTMFDGFLERRFWLGDRLGLGTFIDREAIERRNASQLSDLLRTIPGVRFMKTGVFGYDVVVGRSVDCGRSRIYLDGNWLNRNGGDLDSFAIPSMLEGVEVYRGGSQVPAEFAGSDSRCGVIVLWTQRGH